MSTHSTALYWKKYENRIFDQIIQAPDSDYKLFWFKFWIMQ